MQKKPKTHELHLLTMEEKINIYNEFNNTNKTLIEVLGSRGYFWATNYPSILLGQVIDFLRYKENEEEIKKIIKPIYKKESYKDLLIDYLPQKKEFIFSSKV